MMAKHYPDLQEIRLYSSNDIGNTSQRQTQMGRVSSKFKLRKANSQRVDKEAIVPFDFENAHVAKVYINDNIKKDKKDFVIKSRYCLKCSETADYFCQKDKCWEY